MTRPRVQFLAFPGCPNADAARRVLTTALKAVGLPGTFEDIDVQSPHTPATLRNWASPTILINGRDVADGRVQHATGCRIYDGPDNAPDLESVIQALNAAMTRNE